MAQADPLQSPCPYRVLDDAGGAFAMGALGGAIWHFVKGWRNAPRAARLSGALAGVKMRAPLLGGAFAMWGVLFSMGDCGLQMARGGRDDSVNAIAAGAATGGLLAFRSGKGAIARNAILGGCLLAGIEGMMALFTKYSTPSAAALLQQATSATVPPPIGTSVPATSLTNPVLAQWRNFSPQSSASGSAPTLDVDITTDASVRDDFSFAGDDAYYDDIDRFAIGTK